MPVPFEQLSTCDLHVGEVYLGGSQPHVGADPIARLLGVGNMGGFRIAGTARSASHRVALFTTASQPEWPDEVDRATGIFTYFGDNRTAGRDLHDPKGNRLLRDAARHASGDLQARLQVPPFFVLESAGEGRAVRFLGLAALGAEDSEEDLISLWGSSPEGPFLNYRARFTLLDVPTVSREWLDAMTDATAVRDASDWPELVETEEALGMAPLAWQTWLCTGVRAALGADPGKVADQVQETQVPILDSDVHLAEDLENGRLTISVRRWMATQGVDPSYFEHGESAMDLPSSLVDVQGLALEWRDRAERR